MSYAKDAVKFMRDVLEDGFNPFTAARSPQVQPKMFKGLISQLVYVQEHLNVHASQSQKNTYKEIFNRLSLWIEQEQIHDIDISAIDLEKAKRFKKWALYDKDLAPKTVNNTLSYLGIYWDMSLEKQLVNSNPWRVTTKCKKKDKVVDKNAKVRFEPITDKEMKIIFPKLKANGEQNFINFLSFVYYAWARPIEILRLKIDDIEFERELIRFRKTETKNGKANYVQIVPPLLEILKEMDLRKFPKHYYIFSTGYQPGIIHVGKNNPSSKWNTLVREGMSINKDLYALKHTGNIEYLLNNRENLNLKWQQTQNRHSSAVMTETYNRQLGAYFIDTKDLIFRKF